MNVQVRNLKNKKKHHWSKIFTYVFGGLIALLLGFQIMGTISASSNFGVASFFGYQTLIVETDSMEPAIMINDAIVIKKVDLSTIKASSSYDAHDGNVITFYRREDGLIVTHRVVEVLPQEDGGFHFRTLGDNLQADTCPNNQCDPVLNRDYVYGEDVLGVVVGKSAFFGNIVNFMTKPLIVAIVAIVPLSYVFISSIIDIIKNSKMKEEDFTSEELESFEILKQQEKLKLLVAMEKEKLKMELAEKQNSVKVGDDDEQKNKNT